MRSTGTCAFVHFGRFCTTVSGPHHVEPLRQLVGGYQPRLAAGRQKMVQFAGFSGAIGE